MKKIEITFTDGTVETVEYFEEYKVKENIFVIEKNRRTGEKNVYPLCSLKKFEIKE
jgi:hypothetical protein